MSEDIKISVQSDIELTPRVKQLAAMFDVPLKSQIKQSWSGRFDLSSKPWRIGLILGPSGSGKSTLARHLFGQEASFDWKASSVIDDFHMSLKIEEITKACSSVGFNTIPSWMKPYGVLSTGEKFRVFLARSILEASRDTILIDEFTSVVDRQTAKIASQALAKFMRAERHKATTNKQLVAVSCHYDIVEWLQPDWIIEPETMSLVWRSVQPRPTLECSVHRVTYDAWSIFSSFHYLTSDMAKSARCFALSINDRLTSFAGAIWQPMRKSDQAKKPIVRCTRLVTHPDWQGLGLAFKLVDTIGSAYKKIGVRWRTYPAHPSLIRSFGRSPNWAMKKKAGTFSAHVKQSRTSTMKTSNIGGRPCGVFEYIGPMMPSEIEARKFLGDATYNR